MVAFEAAMGAMFGKVVDLDRFDHLLFLMVEYVSQIHRRIDMHAAACRAGPTRAPSPPPAATDSVRESASSPAPSRSQSGCVGGTHCCL